MKRIARNKITLTIAAMALIWSCGKDDGPSTPPESTAPTITSFSPQSGPVGTVITINGTNFSTTAAENTVKIGNAVATVSNPTATKLSATVPEGAVTGKVTVTVDGEMATSTDNFTVTEENAAPSISAQSFEVPETATDTDEIGTVSASDEGDVLTFSIAENELFEITEAGVLTLKTGVTLDFEAKPNFEVNVTVADSEGETASATMTITVLDVAEAHPDDKAAFVTTWQTDADGETIYIGLNADYNYDFTINWGDGTVEDINLANPEYIEHIYETTGEYDVAIIGDFPAINMNALLGLGLDIKNGYGLIGIEQWGDIQWQTMIVAFYAATSLEFYNASDAPDLSQVTSMAGMFGFAFAFNGDLSAWETGAVTDMRYMFDEASAFDQNLGGWNIGAIDPNNEGGMTGMFDNSGMSTENMTQTLTGWKNFAEDNQEPSGITLGLEGLEFCTDSEAEARITWLENIGEWTINGESYVDCL